MAEPVRNPDVLKPCPFCGGVAKIRFFERKYYRVSCEDVECECVAESGYHLSEKEAIDAWNRRAEDVSV